MGLILGICGSPRNAATEYVLRESLKTAETVPGTTTEMIALRGKKINFCVHCNRCVDAGADKCVIYDDDMQDWYDLFYQADGYLLASPVYSMGITAQLTAFMNRLRPTYTIVKKDPGYFNNRFGGAISVGGTRNGGQECANGIILNFYHNMGINAVGGGLGVYSGGCVWSRDKKAAGAQEDEIGMEKAKTIALRVAGMVKSNQ